jgi:hypothetical protein
MVVTGATMATPAGTGTNMVKDLFLRDACPRVYELITEGNNLGAMLVRYMQTRYPGVHCVQELQRTCGQMFANTVETERGHSLAEAVLHASFDPYQLISVRSMAAEADVVKELAVVLDKVSV